MNDIDILNIKKELAKREAANYTFDNGGVMTADDIMLRTTNELYELVNNYEYDKNYKISKIIHKLVDDIFDKYADEDDNMIPLSSAYRPEYRPESDDDVYHAINFGDKYYNDNPYVKPIARYWERKDERWDDYYNDLNNLCNNISKLSVPTAEEHWEDDGESLNEYWHGVIAITRDYKIVGFEMRYDGLPQDSNKLNYPCIMTI